MPFRREMFLEYPVGGSRPIEWIDSKHFFFENNLKFDLKNPQNKNVFS